ncbi:MAG: small multi-drug export protein [Clostridia bacterium]|nr:small multi-drug export protein [Clostridia bacterium]MBQ2274487.1 small multi-drug export protein [Clostridia bacterium]MEE1278460.1 small multi-drug export protein [Acutalibacteraceae bacterium]
MAEQLTNFLKDFLRPELIIFIISLMPILELRGGLIAAAILGVDWAIAFPICVIGNMLPIPFELLFIRKIFKWMKRFRPFYKMITWIEERAEKKSKEIETKISIGLFLFVAIPLPGTGAWTGGLVADVLGVKFKKAIPIILVGVITAGLIISFISYILPMWF